MKTRIGDRVPHHIYMTEVQWPEPINPMIHPEHNHMPPPETLTAICILHEFHRALRWGLVALAAGFVVGFCAPPAKADQERRVNPFTAPLVMTPNRPVSCERDRLGQCVGGGK